ncbi:MAG: pyridoxal phosphate-dependent aminotransferase [Candidatus Omnitrophota bacterium]
MNMLAKRARDIEPSSTLAITARAKKMRKDGLDVVNFAAGEPDFDTPQYIKEAAISSIEEGFTKYTPSSGIGELKAAIQKKLKSDNNLDYELEQIVVSCGAKHSLFNIIQVLVDKGEEVIIPSPYWVSYLEMVKFAQGKPVIIKAEKKDSFKLSALALSKNITKKSKLLILNSPSNPAGYIYTKKELEALAEVCVKNKLFVISDEIYEKLIYGNNRHVSIASLNKDIYRLTFVVNGVSKAYSMTGWRIGYLAGDKEIVEATARLQDHSTSCPSSISQKAALAALSSGDEFIDKMRLEFESRRNLMLAGLDKLGLEYIKPEGAFYVFVDISKTKMPSWDFCNKFLEEKYVAAIPGGAFGNDNYVRFSFATSPEQIEKGIQRLREFLSSPR